MEAIQPYLENNERTVGTMINVTHEAATPVGMEVTATVRCIKVEGKKSLWEIEAADEVDVIGRGTHERFVINFDKFTERLNVKSTKA